MRGIIVSLVLGSVATFATAAPLEPVPVRLVVVAPDVNPQPEQIYVAGSFNDWTPGRVAAVRVADGIYVARVMWPRGEQIEYKFTRETTWATVEKGLRGEELGNHMLRLDRHAPPHAVFHVISRWADQAQGERVRAVLSSVPTRGPAEPASTRTGTIHELEVASAKIGKRKLLVWTPPGYADTTERYPVVYVLDGQNVFDASTSFVGAEWRLDETATELIAADRLRPCIIVAIENSASRFTEYTPFADPQHGGGGADTYLAFLRETVKPRIDADYRTRPGPRDTSLVGSSLGGLFTLHAALTAAETFGNLAVIAPSLQWDNYRILRHVDAATIAAHVRLWIEIGVASDRLLSESENEKSKAVDKPARSRYHSAARELTEILRGKGVSGDERLHYGEQPGDFHHERAWAERAGAMLRFLVGAPER